MHRTHLAPEELAYPNGGQTRPCTAIYPDGVARRVWCGISDTFFTIPAHGRVNRKYVSGYVTIQSDSDKPDHGELIFHYYEKPR